MRLFVTMIINNDAYWILSVIIIADMMVAINHDVLTGEEVDKQ